MTSTKYLVNLCKNLETEKLLSHILFVEVALVKGEYFFLCR